MGRGNGVWLLLSWIYDWISGGIYGTKASDQKQLAR
jgi:hypothetical protein